MITIFSDPHLGLNRTSHTTPASRERLKEALYKQAKALAPFTIKPLTDVYCLGDLYDTYWSDANTVKQGLEIYQHVDVCLIGNHDFSQRANATSALRLCHDIMEDAWDEPSEASVKTTHAEGFSIQYVNHKMTQQLFDASLEKVRKVGGVLFLHCNFDNGFATDEASLNLSRAQAEALLEKVDLVFSGHEHTSAAHFNGRLIMTGNTHPTSFSDISDKYSWHVDKDLKVTRELIWSTNYAVKLDYAHLLEGSCDLVHMEFIEIVGQAERAELPKIARAVANLWKTCPNAYMIKNSVTCEQFDAEKVDEVHIADVITTLSAELSHTKLNTLWKHYVGRVQ